jgi:anti-sigma B factor antagonist
MSQGLEAQNGASVFALEGELTIYTVSDVLAGLRDYLKDRQVCDLDLSTVSEIDGAGLQLLLWVKSLAEVHGGRLRLVAYSTAVGDALNLLKLHQGFGADPAATMLGGQV